MTDVVLNYRKDLKKLNKITFIIVYAIIAFYFLAYLVHYFRAATPTIISLLERPASVHYENNVLTVSFPKIRKHYWEKLANLQKKLHQSHFSSIQISYDDK